MVALSIGGSIPLPACYTGGVLVWNAESRLVVAQALWFGGSRPTVNVAEMGALEWGMGKLLSLGV